MQGAARWGYATATVLSLTLGGWQGAAHALQLDWGPHPPVVPSWVSNADLSVLDRDGDGLDDAFEESVAQAFAPQFRFALYEGAPDPARRCGIHHLYTPNGGDIPWCVGPSEERYGEPVLLHSVFPASVDAAGTVGLGVRYVALLARDGGDCSGNDPHHGETGGYDFSAALQRAGGSYRTTFDWTSSEYPSQPGVDRPVVFLSWGKHHTEADPDNDDCGEVMGAGAWVVPETWSSQLGFCEGEFLSDAEWNTQDIDYVGRGEKDRCVPGWPDWAPTTPRGLLNELSPLPWAYRGPGPGTSCESVYEAWPFGGGADAGACWASSEVTPIWFIAFNPGEPAVRLDLGGADCVPVAAGDPSLAADGDGDGIPDGCDPCPGGPDVSYYGGSLGIYFRDLDGDGIYDGCDPCPTGANENTNEDGEDALSLDHVADGCDPHASTRLLTAKRPDATGSGYKYGVSQTWDLRAGEIDVDLRNNNAPVAAQQNSVHTADLTVRRCFCVREGADGLQVVGGDDCLARDLPGHPPGPGAACVKNGVPASAAAFTSGLGWLPFRSFRRDPNTGEPATAAGELEPEACDATVSGSTIHACSRSVTTYSPAAPSSAEEAWRRRPRLTWDAWTEIDERYVEDDTSVPAIPCPHPADPSYPEFCIATPPVSQEPVPSYSGHWPPSPVCGPDWSDCPHTGCTMDVTGWGWGYSCIEAAIPFSVYGPGGLWTHLDAVNPWEPGYGSLDAELRPRLRDGYLRTTFDIPGTRTTSTFHAFPIWAHRFLPPWVPVEELGRWDIVSTLGGTPVVFNVDGVAELALWPSAKPSTVEVLALGPAEAVVRNATALAAAQVSGGLIGAGSGTDVGPGSGAHTAPALAGLELWAYDGSSGEVTRIQTADTGTQILDVLPTGIVSDKAVLAVTASGMAVLAVAGSPWSFYRVDRGTAEPLAPAGLWKGSLALIPGERDVRVIGTVAGRPARGSLELAVADLAENTTGALRLLPSLPAREGMWFGWGRDKDRALVLLGGGVDDRGNGHSDVYALDLDRSGAPELVASDNGEVEGLGPRSWLEGERLDEGWRLRAVPARPLDGSNAVRYGAYERRPASGDGWRPVGLSATDTPRPDVTTEQRLQFQSSCELEGAPWYAPPGHWIYGEEPGSAPLECVQAIPGPTAEHHLPRQVIAFALAGGELWTISPAGLERWALGPSGATQLQVFAALSTGPSSKKPVAVSATAEAVAVARGSTLTLLRRDGTGFTIAGTTELCDDVVALTVAGRDVWAVSARHVTHVRLSDEGPLVADTFDLSLEPSVNDVFARRLEPGTCDGASAPGDVLSASAAGGLLVLGFEHRITAFDLRTAKRLGTIGSVLLPKKLREVDTDGTFVYAHTTGSPAWHAWRVGPRVAFDPVGNAPAHGFGERRQYSTRHAARLTGVALHLASW
jgi:hypothetical protein